MRGLEPPHGRRVVALGAARPVEHRSEAVGDARDAGEGVAPGREARLVGGGEPRHRIGGAHLGVGLVIGLVMFVGLNVLLASVMNSLIPRPPESGPSIMSFFK